MATSVKIAKLTGILTVIESLSRTNVNGSASQNTELKHEISKLQEFTSGTTVDAELVYMGTQALTDGTATIDLLSLADTEGNTIATTGKKVRAIMISPTDGNTGAVTLTEGASTGYELGGNTWSLALSDGDWALIYLGASAPTISASLKYIDISGTGTESIDLIILFG